MVWGLLQFDSFLDLGFPEFSLPGDDEYTEEVKILWR